MNARGISPLIATIFLIAVAVALGSIVMSLGQEYVTQAGSGVPTATCSGISFDIKRISADTELQFTVDNQAGEIDGFLVKSFNEDYLGGETQQVQTTIPAYGVEVFSAPLTETVYEVTFIPLEMSGTELIPCNEKAKTYNRESAVFQ